MARLAAPQSKPTGVSFNECCTVLILENKLGRIEVIFFGLPTVCRKKCIAEIDTSIFQVIRLKNQLKEDKNNNK